MQIIYGMVSDAHVRQLTVSPTSSLFITENMANQATLWYLPTQTRFPAGRECVTCDGSKLPRENKTYFPRETTTKNFGLARDRDIGGTKLSV